MFISRRVGQSISITCLDGWCSDPSLLVELHEHLAKVAADSMMGEARIEDSMIHSLFE